MSLDDRLALAALRGIMLELEGGAGAGEVLARLMMIGSRELAPAGAPAGAPVPPAPVVQRDLKPEKTTKRPAARRRATKSARPAPAASARPKAGRPGPKVDESGEVRELVDQLVVRHGNLRAAAKAAGMHEQMLRRWRKKNGQGCTPASLAKLRAAIARPAPDSPAPRTGRPPRRRRDDDQDDQDDGRIVLHDVGPELAQDLVDAAAGVDDEEGQDEERTEAQAFVAQLVERHGDLATVGERLGFGDEALARWSSGGACSPRALERLREAAHAPIGSGEERRRAAQGANRGADEESASGEEGEAA